MKSKILTSLKLGLPAALFVYLLFCVEPADYQAFWTQPKRWDYLLAAQGLALFAIVLSFVRWRILVESFGIPFSLREAIRLGFLGYLLNFVSFGSVGGDLFKAILVARDKPEKKPEAVASVLLDRAIGLWGLVLLACLALGLTNQELPTLLIGIRNAAALCAASATVALYTAVYAGGWLERILAIVEKTPIVGESLVRMARAVRLLRTQPTVIPLLVGLSITVHILLSVTVYLVSAGTYPEPPSLNQHFVAVPPGMAAGALPLAPGGMGLQEGAIAGLFEVLPGTPEQFSGLLVATVYRLLTLNLAGIGLIFYWLSHGREFQLAKGEAQSNREN